jgi:cation/acetate symporter
MNITALTITVVILAATLGITYWAAGRNKSASSQYVAGGQIRGWVNGLAITGDYVSASSFLGLTGAIALTGFAGYYLMMAIPIAFLVVLLAVAEPLRNLGKYTVADMIASRFKTREVRSVVALNTVIISVFYMVAQFVGAGALTRLLLGIPYAVAVIAVGVLMTIYVLVGGMLATTWIQALKGFLLLAGTVILILLVLAIFGFNPVSMFDEAANRYGDGAVLPPTPSGLLAGLDVISLQIALALGTAGLPHVLIRFLTVPDTRAARSSALSAFFMIGFFFLTIPFIGYGAAVIVGREDITAANPAGNLAAPQLAQILGGDIFFGFIVAVALSIIIATLAGLVIASSGAFGHDFYTNVIRGGEATQREQFVAARVSGAAISILALVIALGARDFNLAFIATLTFAVAASANLPVILLTIYWRRFNVTGAIAGMIVGLASSVGLVLIGPNMMGENAIFPLANPALVSVPLGFLASYLGTLLAKTSRDEYRSYEDIRVKTNIGSLGAIAEAPAAGDEAQRS